MLAPVSQALDALSAEITALLTPSGQPAPEVRVLSANPGLAGIGGFVGLNTSPVAELYGRRLDAEVAVRVLANNETNLASAEDQAVRDIIAADPVGLRQNGILALKRLTDRDSPTLQASDGISAARGRDIFLNVRFEHLPIPAAPEGVLGALPLDTTVAGLSRDGGLIYDNDFAADPLGDFVAQDTPGGSGSNGNWSFDGSAGEVLQTGTKAVGNNGLIGNKAGTYLTLSPSAGGDLTNFVVTAEMRNGGNGGIGFVFRFQDPDNFGFVLMELPTNLRVMGKRIAGTGSLLDEGGQDATTGYPADTWLSVRFLADGDRFELAVDQQIVLSGRDAALSEPGSVGFFCRRADTARFRHFRLSRL